MGGCTRICLLVSACCLTATVGACASPKPLALASPEAGRESSRRAPTSPEPPPARAAEIVPVKHEAETSPGLASPPNAAADVLRPGRLASSPETPSSPPELSFSREQPRREVFPVSSRSQPSTGRPRVMSKLASATVPEMPASAETIAPGQRDMPIDLPTALRLANAQNLQVALAREQIRQALARVDAAQTLWLPSIRGGLNYNRHDGAIQAVDGTQFNTSRAAFYSGLGAGIYGAGTPMVPGIYANFHLTDALFQPLAARQSAGARSRAAMAATNDALLNVSLAYLELLRAHEELAIAQGIQARVQTLADLTGHYARTGQGLQADADRLQTELMLRKNEVLRGVEACQVASARLAQLLHLDPTVILEPIEPAIVPLDLTPPEIPLSELVAQGLSRRPELAESRLLVAEAVTLLRRERLAPLLPSVLLGTSYGAMSAGINTNMAPGTGRLDADAVAYWELRNLGLGDRAARDGASSLVRQAQVKQLAVMDQVSREVTEASAQSQARRRQIEIARDGVQAAVESHQRNLDRIEAAKGLPIEALQSVQALANAQREYLRSLVDYDAAQFTLYRALGWPARLDLPAAIPPAPTQRRSSRKPA